MRLSRLRIQTSVSAVALATSMAMTAMPAHSQQIEEVIVTARKTSESLQKIPVAVTAISPEQLKAANIVSPLDFKFVTPGLQLTQSPVDNTNINFKIRGIISGTGFGESSIATYVDGVFRQLQFGLTSAVYDMERVEVLKGAQGTLYGKNSAGGLVSIITRKPDLEKAGGYITLRGGTYAGGGSGNRKAGGIQGAFGAPIVPGKAAFRIAADLDTSDGFGRGQGGTGRQLNNRINSSVRAHVLFAPNDDWKILLSGDYASFHSNNQTQRTVEATAGALPIALGIAGGFIRLPDYIQFVTTGVPGPTFAPGLGQAIALMSRDFAPGANFYNANGTFGSALLKVKGASLTIDGKLNDDIGVKSITAYRRYDRQSSNDLDGTTLHEFETSTRDKMDFWSEELNFFGKVGAVDWQAGGFYAHYSDDVGGVPGLYNKILVSLLGTLTAYDANQKNNSTGLFAHGAYHFNDQFTLSAGVRWSQDSRTTIPRDTTRNPATLAIVACADALYGGTLANNCVGPALRHKDHAFSYDVALNYQVNPDLMLYAKTARGYKAGNINTNGSYTDFQPEFVQDWELGMKSEWLDRTLLLNLAGYYNKYTNIQRTVVVSLPNGSTGNATNNAASAHIWGGEVEATIRPTKGLELAFNYAYTDPKYDRYVNNGVDLSGEAFEFAKHTINTHIQYSMPVNDSDTLMARLDYIWQSHIVFAAYTELFPNEAIMQNPAYGLVNARLSYDIGNWDTNVALYVRNLGGKKYYIGATGLRSVGTSFMTPGEPRFIGIELTKKFGGG